MGFCRGGGDWVHGGKSVPMSGCGKKTVCFGIKQIRRFESQLFQKQLWNLGQVTNFSELLVYKNGIVVSGVSQTLSRCSRHHLTQSLLPRRGSAISGIHHPPPSYFCSRTILMLEQRGGNTEWMQSNRIPGPLDPPGRSLRSLSPEGFTRKLTGIPRASLFNSPRWCYSSQKVHCSPAPWAPHK